MNRWMWCAGLLLVVTSAASATPRGAVSAAATTEMDWKAAYDQWRYPQPLPDFQLQDQTGAPLALSSLDNAYVLVGFVFSRCPMPQACPLTMSRFAAVQVAWKRLEQRGLTQGRRLVLLGITLDPAFDTPAVLKRWSARYGADPRVWKMATGPHGLVGSALPSMFAVLARPDAHGVVSHNVKVGLMGPGRHILAEWPDNTFTPEDVLALVLGAPDGGSF